MNHEAPNWQRVTEKLRRAMGLTPPTPEEADEAMRTAGEVSITDGQIDAIVRGVVGDKLPRHQALEQDASWLDEIDTEDVAHDTRLVMNRNANEDDDGGEEVDDEVARRTEEALNDDEEEDS
jgi:hypothetical protein